MAVIAQEYYDILKSIQTELRVKDTSIASPNYVNVDLATRTIDLSSGGYKDFLSVEKDHRAETIYFEVPRYFDDVDLASKNIIIEYQNKDGNFIYPVPVKDTISKPGYIRFGWCIGSNATKYKGDLTFAIRFYQVDLNEQQFIYSLRTKPAIGKILYGLSGAIQGENLDYPEFTLATIQQSIENVKPAWHNL